MVDTLATDALLCALLFAAVVVFLMAGFPVALTLAGTALAFAFGAAQINQFDLSLLTAFAPRLFAIMTNDVLTAVPLFVLMGVLLERTRIAEELLLDISRLLGTRRSGLGIAVCLVGALLAASTGIVGATVVAMGMISLPAMLRQGYSPALASGTVAAAGTLGQIIPPSIVLVLLGDQIAGAWSQAQYELGNYAPDAISINDLFAGALLPGLMLVGLYMLWVSFATRKMPAPVGAQISSPVDASQLARSMFAPVLLVVTVLGSILAGLATVSEASGFGALGALLIAGYRAGGSRWIPTGTAALGALLLLGALVDLRLHDTGVTVWQTIAVVLCVVLIIAVGMAILALSLDEGLADICQRALRTTCMIFLIVIGASLFALVFRGLGGDDVIRALLDTVPGGALTLLVVVMLMMFLLGFVLDFLEILYIVVPVVAPVLLTLELSPGVPIDPIWLAVLISVNLQTSFLTPPMGFSLFYLRAVAPDTVSTGAMYRGVAPFVCLQILMLVLLWFFPALATWLPSVLSP